MVREYDNYIKSNIYKNGYIENLFGRRYCNISSHEAKNYLIQGSCADYTKKLLPKIRKLIKSLRSEMENYLHDEFAFRIYKSEMWIIPKLKEIMEQLESPIPMLVDLESSTTDWSEKHDFEIS